MDGLNEEKLAGVTFHTLVFDRKREWDRTRESLLRFLHSVEGRRFVSRAREPIVLLVSGLSPRVPYYLHITDGAFEVLPKLDTGFFIFTLALLEELPDNQIVQFSSLRESHKSVCAKGTPMQDDTDVQRPLKMGSQV